MSAVVLSTAPGGAALSAGTFNLHALGGQAPRRFFRQTFYLRVNVPPAEIAFAAAAKLTVRFVPQTYNAINHAAAPLRAGVSKAEKDGAFFVVTLGAPRRFINVRLSGVTPARYRVFRMDGDALSSEPTLDRVYTAPPLPPALAVMSGGAGATTPASSSGGAAMIAVTHDMFIIGEVSVVTMGQPFVDQRFALRFVNASNAILSPAASAISELMVSSCPTGARIGLAAPEQLDQAIFFWQQPGESTTPITAALGPALVGALERHVRDRAGEAPPFDIALVVESDAECGFDLLEFAVRAHRVIRTFATGEAKQVLRFEPGGPLAQSARAVVPRAAAIVRAEVTAVESLRDQRLAGDEGDDAGLSGESSALGAYLGPGRAAAQRFTPSAAITVSGLALAFSALEAATTLSADLQEDWQGIPSGRSLGGGEVTLTRIGEAVWAIVTLPKPVVLPTMPHWIIVRAGDGSGVWLAQPSEDTVGLFEQRGERTVWSPTSALDGLRARYRLLTVGAGSGDGAGIPSPAVLTVGGQTPASSPVDAGSRRFDFSVALSGLLTAAPAEATTIEVPLHYTSPAAGLVTLKDLHIEYEA